MSAAEILKKEFGLPDGAVDVVLDTDTYNEMDDQFAVAFAVRSPERIRLRAITAAPFFNDLSTGPEDGMLKSAAEARRLLEVLKDDTPVFEGSRRYLADARTPVDSPAARRIAELARECEAAGRPLVILAIAAITNVASAILMEPAVARSSILIWLGGHPYEYKRQQEFNFKQDLAADAVIYSSGIRLVQIPCLYGAETLITTLPELRERCLTRGPIGQTLWEIANRFMVLETSRIIWDISTVAMLTAPEAFEIEVMPTPILNGDGTFTLSQDSGGGKVGLVRHVDRDPVFNALFAKLS